MIACRLLRRPDGSIPADPPHAVEPGGITIGRAPECQVVLDDPTCGVSRQHARLIPQLGGETALLRCLSAKSPLSVNGEALLPGAERFVKSGDLLYLCGFELRLESAEVTTILKPPSAPAAAPLTSAMKSMRACRPSRVDEWFELDTAPDPLGPDSPLPALDGQTSLRRLRPATHPCSTTTFMAASDETTKIAPPRHPPSSSPTESPQLAPAPAPSPSLVASVDLALPIAEVADAVQPLLAVTSVDLALPIARGKEAPMPAPSIAPSLQPPAIDHEALRRAFLRGAGLPEDPVAGTVTLDTQWMAHLGALLRAATEGTLASLHSRNLEKGDVRTEGTRISPRQSNPLKFAPNAADALTSLLKPQSARGFQDPVDAVRHAHADLQFDQQAMLAGMRAAASELISSLGPNALEAGEPPARGLAKVFPALREAALWRRYRRQHASLQGTLHKDLAAIFVREFVRAYEEQSRLAGARTLPPADGAAFPTTRHTQEQYLHRP
jgi:type VI secretion system FHA domain protein